MTNYLDEYQKQQEENLKQAKDRLKEACKILEPLGITMIDVEYDGSGDEGAVESVTFSCNGSEYKGDLPKEKFESLFVYSQEKPRVVHITEVIEEICYHFLPDGWGNGDGAFGILKIDIKKKIVTIEHNQRYTEVSTSEEEFKL
jgi:hypothetical protein